MISAELESDIADQQRLIVKLEPGVRIREGRFGVFDLFSAAIGRTPG